MSDSSWIAVDAMGGDEGLAVMLAGVARARRRFEGMKFLLVGDEAAIREGLKAHPNLSGNAEIVHAPDVVGSSETAGRALRRAKTTSMGVAIDCVKQGRAGAAVSSGNTGALMAMAKLSLRTMPGIDRPALAAMLPSLGDNDVVMLDLGANTECDARNLMQFAVMGAAYARTTLDLESPRVALLNIGSEDQKGTEEIRDAAQGLRAATHLPMRFTGFIEGDQIARGHVDVIVCDGFSGNIALKTAEGTARFVADLLKRAFTSSVRSKIGFLISRPATQLLRDRLDPNNHNGAVFLGLNGLVLKSHGGANEIGVATAIGNAAKMVKADLARRIAEDLGNFEKQAA
ncbi:phosphate acyltransferase PlsX [uncultured Sphingomonas sp.]|uniref:phosphate acyltransferase PlsX n=1 Tax=uncultured Sphingomonas sp. TaxID=158754 RepID=UPI00261A2FD4|nr:phosphate acyltransferase PlsX [uncultured Sphingomonas sp.]